MNEQMIVIFDESNTISLINYEKVELITKK